MSLLQIPAPNLGDVGASTSALYLLEAAGFSADGGTLLVKATFDSATLGQLRTGVWVYDLAGQSYTGCLNTFLVGDVDVSAAQMVVQGGQTLFVAQYAPADGQADAQLAVIRDGVAQELGQQLGLDNPLAVQRFALSADGRFLAIQSLDSTLAPINDPDSNEASDIYLIDLQTQQTTRVSFVAGTQVNTDVHLGSVVVTGGQLRVTFSTAGQFSTQDKNDAAPAPEDAYQWSSAFDATGLTGSPSFSLLSVDLSNGLAAGGVLVSPGEPMASSAGVWFESSADSIVAGDNNGAADIFYRPYEGLVQKLELSGVSSFSSPVYLLSISADGSYAAVLVDDASALSAGAPPVPQLLVWQRATQKWVIVSQASAGLADADVLSGVLSPNGQWVAFTSMASNLGGTDPQALTGQLFVASAQSALNHAPTGAVTITGTAKQGQTLTASNTLADLDGLGTISYQWLADGTAISGATASTLVLTQAQVGKAISVKASYTDGGAIAEAVTSNPTAAVANVNDAPVATAAAFSTNEDAAKTGTLAGTDLDGNTLTFTKATDPAHGTVTVNAQTGAYTYTPAANFNGSDSFTFTVNDGTADSAAATVSITVNAVNDAPVATAASLSANEDAAKTGTLAGTDLDGNTLSFVKATDPANGTVTVNAQTGAYTYTPTANFNGSDSFTFKVNDGIVDSAAATVSITVNAVNDAPTGGVTITGTAKQGQTLTASNTLADVDGLGTISYQWLAGGAAISGATGATLVLAQAQVGKLISVKASYTDGSATAEAVTSSATAAVSNLNDAPTGAVTISGTAKQGQTLTASNTLADVDGLGTISYQWLADGTAISGATGSTLVLGQAQVGKLISVKASYTDGQGTAESLTSAPMASAVVQTFDFSGQVYEWKTHALLPGVSLTADASTVQTSAVGHFDLTGLLHSNVGVSASKVLASSDIQAAITVEDALAALKIAAGRNPNANGAAVSPYQFMAADFNGDGQVTSADALAILKVALGKSDAPAAQWLFVQESQDFWNDTSHAFTTSRKAVTWDKVLQFDAPGTHNLVAVLKGDVNGSWSAPVGAVDLDVSSPGYFSDLAAKLGVPVAQWGFLSV